MVDCTNRGDFTNVGPAIATIPTVGIQLTVLLIPDVYFDNYRTTHVITNYVYSFKVGTNLLTVMTSKKSEITVREIGGSMAPIWHNYYNNCPALMVSIFGLIIGSL